MQRICSMNDVTLEKPFRTKVKGIDLLICRGEQNVFFVIENRCSHQDFPLHKGHWNSESCQISCPAHGAVFDLCRAGAPLNPPAVSPLELFPCELRETEIFANLA